ncbi:MAG: DNA polymerase IV [Planctomycetota bacterium]
MTEAGVQRRWILHVDMDAFFASVEQLDDPAVRGKPVLVGFDGPRGVVAAASYEARVFGCHSAQPMAVAKRLCPHAVIKRGSRGRYSELSHRVFEILERYTPLVQPISIDEAFLDVSGSLRALGSAEDIAVGIRRDILKETGLTASVGVAPNKFLAKVASEMDKPDGLRVIPHELASEIIAPLPVGAIPGLGPRAQQRLREVGVETIGQLRDVSEDLLSQRLGSSAARFADLARGHDERPVRTDREAKSIGHERTFAEDIADPDAARQVLLRLCEDVGRRLRRKDLQARAVTIKLRYGDFETITRSHSLDDATSATDVLWQTARTLFDRWAARSFRPLRLLGVTAGRFGHESQLGLFVKPQGADKAADAVAARFGKDALVRASTLRRKPTSGHE